MTIQKKTRAKVPTLEAIANVVGECAGEVYGIVALAPQKTLVDDINIFLKKENYKDGISVRIQRDGSHDITIYCVMAFGVKVNEVIVEVQNHVKYALEKKFKIPFKKINVFVQNIR